VPSSFFRLRRLACSIPQFAAYEEAT